MFTKSFDDIREYLLSFPDCSEETPFGPENLVYKVNNKMFALLPIDSEITRLNLKCNPEYALELRESYPDLILPGYHMSKKHWNTVICDFELPTNLVKDLIQHSYDLVAPKKKPSSI